MSKWLKRIIPAVLVLTAIYFLGKSECSDKSKIMNSIAAAETSNVKIVESLYNACKYQESYDVAMGSLNRISQKAPEEALGTQLYNSTADTLTRQVNNIKDIAKKRGIELKF
jgi:hypothetical protein